MSAMDGAATAFVQSGDTDVHNWNNLLSGSITTCTIRMVSAFLCG